MQTVTLPLHDQARSFFWGALAFSLFCLLTVALAVVEFSRAVWATVILGKSCEEQMRDSINED